MRKFENRQVKYHILVHSTENYFTNEPCDFTSLFDKVDRLIINGEVRMPALDENLKKVGEAFKLTGGERPYSEKVGTS